MRHVLRLFIGFLSSRNCAKPSTTDFTGYRGTIGDLLRQINGNEQFKTYSTSHRPLFGRSDYPFGLQEINTPDIFLVYGTSEGSYFPHHMLYT